MKVLTRFTFLLLASFAIHYSQAQTSDSTLKGMNWRNIGPNRGGRSLGVAGSSKNKLEYYFGAVGGGLWNSPNLGATNESGFSGLPGNTRYNITGMFGDIGSFGTWWSDTGENGGAWHYFLSRTNERFDRGWATNLESGYSVRCLKDDSTKLN